MHRLTFIIPFTLLAFLGCESNLQPLRPLQRVEIWVPDETADLQPPTSNPATMEASSAATSASTLASTLASSQPATSPDSQPATRPGHLIVKLVDPNQTQRFVYQATYENVWQQSIDLLKKSGFTLDRQDYRLGVLSTKPLPSPQFIEFWKPSPNAKDAFENSINSQRRIVRITISKVPGKPDFHEIAIQVLVERESNPTEQLGAIVFVEGSGFGRNRLSLQSDYLNSEPDPERWYTVGHDPDLENKLLEQLILRI